MSATRKDAKRAWNRPQLTIRLTEDRRMRLARLAELEALDVGPGAVVDRAIELALCEPDGDDERLMALESKLDATERARAEDAALARAALSQVAQELARLRALIAALAEGE